MGNRPPTGGIPPANADYSCTTRIGESFKIEFKGNVDKDKEGETRESWSMLYKYNAGKKPLFSLSKRFRNCNTSRSSSTHHPDDELKIKIESDESLFVTVKRDATTGLLKTEVCNLLRLLSNVATNAYGEIESTRTRFTRNEEMKSLVVVKEKRKSDNKYPYKVTVAHYYCVYDKDRKGVVGLSVAVKMIRLSDNEKLDFCVNGPQEHPVEALAYMFNQVNTTKTWKPTDCPHCANKYILDRQSESDSDSESESDHVSQPIHGRRPNPPTLVSNPGRFKGKNMGNTYIGRFYERRR